MKKIDDKISGGVTMSEQAKTRLDEIEEKINEMSKYTKARMFGIYERNEERYNQLKPIYDAFDRPRDGYIQEIFDMEEGMHIVKFHYNWNNKTELRYTVFLDMKPTNVHYYSYPEALVGALTLKYQGCNSDLDKGIVRMLEIPQVTEPVIIDYKKNK